MERIKQWCLDWILWPLVKPIGWLIEHDEAFGNGIATTLRIFRKGLKLAIELAHWIGTIVMLLLMSISLMVVWHVLAVELGFEGSTFPVLYEIFERNALNKVLWTAIAVIFTTTVSIRHLWNYQVNLHKLRNELEERWKREYEEKYQRRISK